MAIERISIGIEQNHVVLRWPDNGFIRSQSMESFALVMILNELRQSRPGWKFTWLIERRDTPSPQWLTAGFGWTDVAANALWFAKKEDADYVAGEMDCNHSTFVCEHGFDVGNQS